MQFTVQDTDKCAGWYYAFDKVSTRKIYSANLSDRRFAPSHRTANVTIIYTKWKNFQTLKDQKAYNFFHFSKHYDDLQMSFHWTGKWENYASHTSGSTFPTLNFSSASHFCSASYLEAIKTSPSRGCTNQQTSKPTTDRPTPNYPYPGNILWQHGAYILRAAQPPACTFAAKCRVRYSYGCHGRLHSRTTTRCMWNKYLSAYFRFTASHRLLFVCLDTGSGGAGAGSAHARRTLA